MLHGVEISDSKATYLNRYVQTRGWKIEQTEGKAVWSGLLEPPQMNNPYGPYKNPANTALVYHAGQLLALWEGGNPHEIKVPELETIGEYTYNGKLTSPFTAHPKVDPVTGEMMFIGYSFQPPYLNYGVVSPTGELLRTVPIDLPIGVMMHDFAISENYTIFLDLPLTFSIQRMQRGEPMIKFESDRPSRFGILPRHGDNSQIRWFESSPCYIFHVLNAYEQGDEVVLVACRMKATNVLVSDDQSREKDADVAYLHRWRFNLTTGIVQEEKLDDVAGEFPRINENFLGRKNQYGYVGKLLGGSVPLFDGVIKYDIQSGQSQTYNYGAGRYGGEVVFAPRPDPTLEDDGWLVTFVYDEGTETSELLVLDAQQITQEPVARVLIPQRVPYGFHGTWISESQMQHLK
jgi:carotenoid cleavage dioxygenase